MFDFELFIGLAILAVPPIAVVVLVRSIKLNRRLHKLENKIATLERQLTPSDSPLSQPAAAPESGPAAPESAPPQQVTSVPYASRSAERAPAPASVPISPRPVAATEPSQKIGFGERFGTRWVVWVGGIALALGGIFLVRYSIEQGLVGPGVRIMLGGLLAAALIVAGEWQRRTERQLSFPGVRSANIPSVLTAA